MLNDAEWLFDGSRQHEWMQNLLLFRAQTFERRWLGRHSRKTQHCNMFVASASALKGIPWFIICDICGTVAMSPNLERAQQQLQGVRDVATSGESLNNSEKCKRAPFLIELFCGTAGVCAEFRSEVVHQSGYKIWSCAQFLHAGLMRSTWDILARHLLPGTYQ